MITVNVKENELKKLIDACTARGNVVTVDDTSYGYTVAGNETGAMAQYLPVGEKLIITLINKPYHITEEQVRDLILRELHG